MYDCDAPKVRISVDVYSRKRPDGKSSKVSVYSQVYDGGFERTLKMEDGATIELSHIVKLLKLDVPAGTNPGSDDPAAGEAEGKLSSPATVEPTAAVTASRRRVSTLPFRRRNRNDVAGPALRVVDVDAVTEPSPTTATIATPKQKAFPGQTPEVHVRVSLTLEALDEEGEPLGSPNSQTTRLVIVRAGHEASEVDEVEDSRHWTVQVVRRDATVRFLSYYDLLFLLDFEGMRALNIVFQCFYTLRYRSAPTHSACKTSTASQHTTKLRPPPSPPKHPNPPRPPHTHLRRLPQLPLPSHPSSSDQAPPMITTAASIRSVWCV